MSKFKVIISCVLMLTYLMGSAHTVISHDESEHAHHQTEDHHHHSHEYDLAADVNSHHHHNVFELLAHLLSELNHSSNKTLLIEKISSVKASIINPLSFFSVLYVANQIEEPNLNRQESNYLTFNYLSPLINNSPHRGPPAV